DPVPGDVMCAAVLSAVTSGVRRVSSSGDVVRVAPLMIGSAVPARFVWICGLSDGVFPCAEHRPAFDLVGRHPTLFDATVRERDALALLKAAMGARERLALSYVGRNVRSNEELPPAVPLTDLVEWFEASGLEVTRFQHPLQAYSPRYFTAAETPEGTLPPSYSAANHDAAVALAGTRDGSRASLAVAPFAYAAAGDTVIEVDDLAAFYSRPNHFLARRRMDVRLSKPGYDNLEDEDSLAADLPRDLERTLLLRGADAVDADEEAERMVESGVTMDRAELAAKMKEEGDAGEGYRGRRLKYKKAESDGFTCADDKTAAGAFAEWEDGAESVPYHVELDVDGCRVILTGCRREVKLNVLPKGRLAHVFVFSDYAAIYDSTMVDAWVRHVAGHAAGGDGFVTAMMCKKDGPVRTFRPLPQAEARAILARLVAQAMQPLPFDFAAAMAHDDALPPAFAEALGGYAGRIVSSYGR
ncbi:MAG: exodeoxyribonuclease V subunit gamma, partial [Kiritimatiellae bacterium]|nr:exodeoxyribonuclease V subunit gamma [Kiritimatiellia bacterium]